LAAAIRRSLVLGGSSLGVVVSYLFFSAVGTQTSGSILVGDIPTLYNLVTNLKSDPRIAKVHSIVNDQAQQRELSATTAIQNHSFANGGGCAAVEVN